MAGMVGMGTRVQSSSFPSFISQPLQDADTLFLAFIISQTHMPHIRSGVSVIFLDRKKREAIFSPVSYSRL